MTILEKPLLFLHHGNYVLCITLLTKLDSGPRQLQIFLLSFHVMKSHFPIFYKMMATNDIAKFVDFVQ